jgi:hypothetical protein
MAPAPGRTEAAPRDGRCQRYGDGRRGGVGRHPRIVAAAWPQERPGPPGRVPRAAHIEPACPRRPSGLSRQPSTAAGLLGSSSRRCPLHDHPELLAEPALPKRARSRPRQPPPVSSRAQALTVAQKSGFCAVGTSEYAPGYHSGFSAQTSSGHSSKARRNVTVADQGIVKTPASSTVSWICSPLPL